MQSLQTLGAPGPVGARQKFVQILTFVRLSKETVQVFTRLFNYTILIVLTLNERKTTNKIDFVSVHLS